MFKHPSLRVLVFTLWFALLQTFAPFLHAHFGENAQAVDHGPHLHIAKAVQLAAGVQLSDQLASPHSALDWHTDLSTPLGHILSLDQAIVSKKSSFKNANFENSTVAHHDHAIAWSMLDFSLALFALGLLFVALASTLRKLARRTVQLVPLFIANYALRAPPTA